MATTTTNNDSPSNEFINELPMSHGDSFSKMPPTPQSTVHAEYIDVMENNNEHKSSSKVKRCGKAIKDRIVAFFKWFHILNGKALGCNIFFGTLTFCLCIGLSFIILYSAEPRQTRSFDQVSYVFNGFNASLELDPIDDRVPVYNVRLDAHSHTTKSDGRLEPSQLVDWGISSGYNVMIITDHQTVSGGLAAREYVQNSNDRSEKMLIIPGMEHTSCRIHMNLIGIEENIPLCGESKSGTCSWPTDLEIQQVIDMTHAAGGIVMVNHIPWSSTLQSYRNVSRLQRHPSIEELLAWGVDAVEVVNHDTFDLPSYQFARKNNMTILSGSDTHFPGPNYAWTILNVPDINQVAVMEELKQGRTSVLFDARGTFFPENLIPDETPTSQAYDIWTFWANEIQYLLFLHVPGLPSFQGESCHARIDRFHGRVLGNLVAIYITVIALALFVYCLRLRFLKV